ncbi:MAG: hypothetical protein HC851_01715 [Acaryochloris sp. RU_4_1]|nr:hypothetical protein [Acaryochloris sp. RU_4_1]NJR53354.1 hypothetical protein [Acaryochloris sp. CRU_2_0]
MDCSVCLTNRDIDNIIAVLYLQTHLEDEIALNLIDKLHHELDRCIDKHSAEPIHRSDEYLQIRQNLTRQLYFQNRPYRSGG